MLPWKHAVEEHGILQQLEIVPLMTTCAANRNRHGQPERDPTPPASEQSEFPNPRYSTSTLDTEAPSEYQTRDYDWFTPGRYFKIWARDGDNVDIEIHEKEFVLLDTKNIEGPGLLVRAQASDHHSTYRGSFNRSHVLLQNHEGASARSTMATQSYQRICFMDEDEHQVAVNIFIELEHTYNIPFVKYKCIDRGVLARSSLRDLRRFYVEWLKYHWVLD